MLLFASPTHHKTVILRGCDFFDFSCFWYTQPECLSELPQDRHPERSASRIYRLTEGLQRVVEGPRRCLLADAIRSFPATNYKENQKKSQALSEAPHRFIAWYSAGRGVEEPVLSVAEGPRGAFILLMLLAPFQPPKPAPGGPATVQRFGTDLEVG